MTKIKIKANGNVIDVEGATVSHMVPRYADLVTDDAPPAATRYEPNAEQKPRPAQAGTDGPDA